MLETVHFIVLDVFELLDLPLPGSFLVLGLGFDECVVLFLFGLPPGQIFFGLSPQILLCFFQVCDFVVAGSDFFFFDPDGFPQFRNEAVFFCVLIGQALDLALQLFDLQFVYLFHVF